MIDTGKLLKCPSEKLLSCVHMKSHNQPTAPPPPPYANQGGGIAGLVRESLDELHVNVDPIAKVELDHPFRAFFVRLSQWANPVDLGLGSCGAVSAWNGLLYHDLASIAALSITTTVLGLVKMGKFPPR